MSVSRSTNINSLITVNISDIVPFPIPWNTHAEHKPSGIPSRNNASILNVSVIITPRCALDVE